MSISKKILLVSLMASGSFYSIDNVQGTAPSIVIQNNIPNQKPDNVTKTIINRLPTEYELKLIDAKAKKELKDLNKTSLENICESIEKDMIYLWKAKPFGIENGVVKGAGIVVAVATLAYLYKIYQDYGYENSKTQK